MSDTIIQLTDDSFEKDVINADRPVIVDFWAPWCVNCKVSAPTLKKIEEQQLLSKQ